MKKAPNSPRVISSMVAVALLGLIVGSPAWGQDDLFGSYRVKAENSTNGDEHGGATYLVYKSERSPRLATLLFIQSGGTYPHQAFKCDAKWSKKSDSVTCDSFVDDGMGVIKERLTIGTLSSDFCNELRKDERISDKILEPTACKSEEKCSCYRIEIVPPTPEGKKEAMAPPSSGAGSGKNN